jgi:hypothetical protein
MPDRSRKSEKLTLALIGFVVTSFDLPRAISEIQRGPVVEIKIETPAEIFDEGFPGAALEARVSELAIMELLRAKRLYEHDAAQIFAVKRWEVVEKIKRAGIVPAEREFDQIKGELGKAIASSTVRGVKSGARPGGPRRKR